LPQRRLKFNGRERRNASRQALRPGWGQILYKSPPA
jgi:hypothetical protein